MNSSALNQSDTTDMTSSPSKLNALELVKLLKRGAAEHKGSAGKALLIGGAPGMAGALLLAGNACLYLGAGWTMLEMFDPASAHAYQDSPELMIHLASSEIDSTLLNTQPDVIAIGPGLGKSDLASAWLMGVLHYPNIPLILDADALNLIAASRDLLGALQKRNQQFPDQTVITPHPGEAAKLLGDQHRRCTSKSLECSRKINCADPLHCCPQRSAYIDCIPEGCHASVSRRQSWHGYWGHG